MRCACFLFALFAVLASPLPAQTTTTAPSDPSTPKGALKTLTRALDAGDRTTILDLFAADSEQDRKLAAATADLAQATALLRRAAVQAFGEGKSRALGVDPTASASAAARIDAATETITGDTAIVRTADNEGPPMSLVKRDGKWRVPVAELRKDVEPADIDRNLADVSVQIGLMRALADEIAAGKFATAADARQALDQRIVRGAMPATQPASKPANSNSD